MKFISLILLLVSLITVSSCKKFDKDTLSDAWHPDLAFPLAYSSFNVYNILAKNDTSELIISNPNTGELSLVYSKILKSLTAAELYGHININENFEYNIDQLNLTPSVSYNGVANSIRTEIIQFQTENGEELHHVNFKSGFFNFHFSTQLKQNEFLTLTFPKMLKNGAPLTENVELIYTSGSIADKDLQIDLTGINADFTLDGSQFNTLEVEIQVQVVGNGTNGINSNELFNTSLTSQDLNFTTIDGYFGQNSIINDKDSILLTLFQNTDVPGHFEFKSPKIKFNIDNSFGIPIDLHLTNLKTIQKFPGGQTFDLIGFPTPISINAPSSHNQTVSTSLILDNTNTTNLNSIVTPTPKYFYYESNAIPNPQGNTGVLNFADENSKLTISTDVDLPLEGYMYGFFVQDTVDFSFKQKIENIESLLIKLISTNGFPVDVYPTIKFVNKNYKVLFQIFNNGEKVLDGAPVDANGKVTEPTYKIYDYNLTKENIEELEDVKYLIIRAETNTSGYNSNNPNLSQNVKFFDYYKLDFQLSMNLIYNGSK